jgi:hypothetical protein
MFARCVSLHIIIVGLVYFWRNVVNSPDNCVWMNSKHILYKLEKAVRLTGRLSDFGWWGCICVGFCSGSPQTKGEAVGIIIVEIPAGH